MTDENLLNAAVAAALVIGSIYEWLDKVDRAGGATSIQGVAACNAFLGSLRKNRARVDTLVMRPLQEIIEANEKEQAK